MSARIAHPLAASTLFLTVVLAGCMPPSWAARAVLHPPRRPVTTRPAAAHEEVTITGDGGVALAGWRFRARGPRRGTLIVLHGIGSNRTDTAGVAQRYVARGYDVLSYDSRAHGNSGGDTCSYGVFEKRDIARIIDWLGVERVGLIGTSLGGGASLQAAAEDPRIGVVVAIATFSDLRAVANDRAPFFASAGNIRDAFVIVERDGRFRVDEASPLAAAARVKAPVLLVHGGADRDTPPAHSARIFAALTSRKRLIVVPGAGHNDGPDVAAWSAIDAWLDEAMATGPEQK